VALEGAVMRADYRTGKNILIHNQTEILVIDPYVE